MSEKEPLITTPFVGIAILRSESGYVRTLMIGLSAQDVQDTQLVHRKTFELLGASDPFSNELTALLVMPRDVSDRVRLMANTQSMRRIAPAILS